MAAEKRQYHKLPDIPNSGSTTDDLPAERPPEALRRQGPADWEDGPLPEVRRSALMDQDISRKSGNLIFTFGFPASGKTTFHSFLMRYLLDFGPFQTDIVSENDDGEIEFEINRMITAWKRDWREGRFPAPTPMGAHEIRELRFRTTPLTGVKTPLSFSFLEVSGEMMRTVLPTQARDPVLTEVLSQVLSNEKIRLIILLMISPDVHENDELFMNFVSFVESKLGVDIRARSSLGLIVSKPASALEYLKKYRSGYHDEPELKGELCEVFIREFAPATYRIYYNWPNSKRKMISRFYVGETELRTHETRLVRPDYRSAEVIFAWLYEQFTGRKLGPTLLQRVKEFFAS
jgi:hypothetical protein